MTLVQHSANAPDGLDLHVLNELSLAELEPTLSAGRAELMMQLPALPADIPGGLHYHYGVRVELADASNACCSSLSSLAVEDAGLFELADLGEMAEGRFRAALESANEGFREDAVEHLERLCAGDLGDFVARPTVSVGALAAAACDLAKSIELGLPIGGEALVPLPLPRTSHLVSAAAWEAGGPAEDAREALAEWESFIAEEAELNDLEEAAFRQSSDGLFTSRTDFLLDVEAKAEALRDLWGAEATSMISHLERMLANLQLLDTHLASAAHSLGFDIVCMMQSVTRLLWQNLQIAPVTVERLRWALETIGSAALLSLGTWRSSWRHDLEWRLLVSVGSLEAGVESSVFGAGELAVDAVPNRDARMRVWAPFLDAANAWYDQWLAVTVIPELQGLSTTVSELLRFVQSATEMLLEPLTRRGSELLAGPVPALVGCGAARRCLSSGISAVSMSAAADVTVLGLGPRAQRPWLGTRSEELRHSRAASQIAALLFDRVALFESMLLQVLDVRSLRAETELLASASGQPRLVAAGHASAGRLAHRRVARLGLLAGMRVEAGPTMDSNAAFASVHAFAAEIERSLTEGDNRAAQTGLLRFEGDAEMHPLLFAGLGNVGGTVVRLQLAESSRVRMHAEVHAFLLSPTLPADPEQGAAVFQANGDDVEPSADSELELLLNPDRLAVPHIELELFNLASDVSPAHRFRTRHVRRGCTPLDPVTPLGFGEYGRAAALPLAGAWVLKARDGPTQLPVTIDAGTQIRILFKIDVPDGPPPWEVLDGLSDVLYSLPPSGQCDEITTIFGFSLPATPMTSTSTSEVFDMEWVEDFAQNVSGTKLNTTTTTAARKVSNVTTTRPVDLDLESFLLVPLQETSDTGEESNIDPLFLVCAPVGVLLACCFAVAFGSWCGRRSRVSQKVGMGPPSPKRASDVADVCSLSKPAPSNVAPAVDMLRGTASAPPRGVPAPGISASWLPARIGHDAKPPDKAPREWRQTDTPRQPANDEVESSSFDSSSGSEVGDWKDGATPPGASPRSSSGEDAREAGHESGKAALAQKANDADSNGGESTRPSLSASARNGGEAGALPKSPSALPQSPTAVDKAFVNIAGRREMDAPHSRQPVQHKGGTEPVEPLVRPLQVPAIQFKPSEAKPKIGPQSAPKREIGPPSAPKPKLGPPATLEVKERPVPRPAMHPNVEPPAAPAASKNVVTPAAPKAEEQVGQPAAADLKVEASALPNAKGH